MPKVVEDAVQLLPLVELTDITTFALVGVRKGNEGDLEEGPDGATPPVEPQLEVRVRQSDGEIEARVRMTVRTLTEELVADIGATYSVEAGHEVTDRALEDFLERVAVMAIFPFLREAIHTTATRLGVAAPVIGLLRQGGFKVEASDED